MRRSYGPSNPVLKSRNHDGDEIFVLINSKYLHLLWNVDENYKDFTIFLELVELIIILLLRLTGVEETDEVVTT